MTRRYILDENVVIYAQRGLDEYGNPNLDCSDLVNGIIDEDLRTLVVDDVLWDKYRIHRRDTAVALTRGMMGTGRRTGRARSRSMGLRVVGGGHASGQVAAGSGGGRRKRPGGMPEVALAGWAGMSLRDSPWGCPVDGSGADGAPSGW